MDSKETIPKGLSAIDIEKDNLPKGCPVKQHTVLTGLLLQNFDFDVLRGVPLSQCPQPSIR